MACTTTVVSGRSPPLRAAAPRLARRLPPGSPPPRRGGSTPRAGRRSGRVRVRAALEDGIVVTPSPRDASCPSDWWKDAIVYQIFPDRFAPDPSGPPAGAHLDPWGSPPTIRSFQGGSLRGVLHHLDHIQSLGVNCLYLTPVFLSTANHRYHPSDFTKVDPMLGGEDALRDLIAECKRREIRFVLDGVFNHTGRGHWAFASLLDAQEQSPYKDWFLPKSFPVVAYGVERHHVNYECWWDLPDLPKLNFDNQGVVEHILDVGAHWVREFGVDGWRLDYPIEIPDAFWREFRRRCRAEARHVVTIGELFGVRPECVGEGGHFDSLMNYAFGTCAVGFVGGGVELRQDDAIGGDYQITPVDADGFRRAYGDVCAAYQSAHDESADGGLGGGSAHPSMLMNLFDSHDTARALWMLRGDDAALELLLLMQACAPGPPMIYQGTEVGQIGQLGLDGSGRDPHNRQAFPWHERDRWNEDILAHVREVGALRNETYALRRGGMRWRDARAAAKDADENSNDDQDASRKNPRVIAWERYFDDAARDGPGALCVFHSGKDGATGPTLVDAGFGPNAALQILHGKDRTAVVRTDADGRVELDLPPQSGVVLAPMV